LKALALFALVALALLPGLGAQHIWSKDEARPALVVREMLATGDWAIPHIGGRVYVEKPPLFAWLVAGLSGGGVTSWSLRLPSVVAAAGAVAVTFLLGTRLVAPAAGLVAAGLLASSFAFVQWARTGRMEMLLVLWLVLAFWSLLRWLDGGRAIDAALLGLWVGLGLLTKGPVALVPLGVGAVALVLGGGHHTRRAVPGALLALGVAALVPLAWLGAAALTSPDAGAWISGVGPRVVHEVEERPRRALGYPLAAIAGGVLPWTLALPAIAVLLWQRWRQAWRPLLVPLLWAAVFIITFSLLIAPREAYFLPLYPALAILAGWAWHEGSGRLRTWILAGAAAVSLVLALLAAGVCLSLVTLGVGPGGRIPVEPSGPLAALAALAVAGPVIAWTMARAGRADAAILALAAAALIAQVVLEVGVHTPALNRLFPTPSVAARFAARLPADAPVLYADFRVAPAVAVYLPNPPVQLRPPGAHPPSAAIGGLPPGAWLLVPEPELEGLRTAGVPLREVDRAEIDRVVYVLATTGPRS
jgi:4-amino-4-deoxy-L-arabinose transferase-like glycosyltransferase